MRDGDGRRREHDRGHQPQRDVAQAEHDEGQPDGAEQPAVVAPGDRTPEERTDQRADASGRHEDPDPDVAPVEHVAGEHGEQDENPRPEPEPRLDAEERQDPVIPPRVPDRLGRRLHHARMRLIGSAGLGEGAVDADDEQR